MSETILLTDGYKLDHRRQYPEGTQYVYSNWTPRSCQYFPEAKEGAVVFGIQYAVAKAEAEKLLVAARAEAEANKLREQALTPAILEKMWIEKWDGKLPVYGQVPTIFKDISR